MAVVTACAVFPLVFVGAGVTSKDAGLAYPDWPTSGGHLINPPNWWESQDTRWEHGHRLIGWTVGMLAIAVAVLCWSRGGATRVLALTTLGAIGVQGVLGGLRVTEISTTLAMVHGVWGQVCFCLACCVALFTSRSWLAGRGSISVPQANVLQRLYMVGSAAVFIELVLGAAQRHFGSGTALIAHLLWAVVVALLVGWIVLGVMGQHPGRDLLETLGWMLGVLLVVQLLLGGVVWVATVAGGIHSALLIWLAPSAHVAVGTLLLAACVLLTLCAHHMLRTGALPVEAPAAAQVATP